MGPLLSGSAAARCRASTSRSVIKRVIVIAIVLAALAALVAAPAPAAAQTSGQQPSGFQALAFSGKGGPGHAVYGPNEEVNIIAGFAYYPACPRGGAPDRGLPLIALSDIYIVPAGDPVTGGGSLGNKHTAVAFGLLSLGDTIGITAPTGNLGPGTYTVIFDECQDGAYDPAFDAKWDAAFRVEFPPALPPANPGLQQLKDDAGAAQKALVPALAYCLAKEAAEAAEAAAALASGDPVVLLSVGYVILPVELGQPDECDIVENIFNHFKAIAADPPDPDFRRLTTVPPLLIPDVGAASDPVTVAAARFAAELEALLHAVERYQGAYAGKDPAWVHAHLMQVSDLANNAAVSATEMASREAAGLEALIRDNPNLDELLAGADATRRRILANGLTEADRKLLLNAGAEPASLDRLPSLLRAGPALAPSIAELRRQQAESVAHLRGLAGTLRQLATHTSSLADSYRNDVPVERRQPRADAGGPYTATGAPLTLTAAASRADEGATLRRWDWDLDGDGSFDDAAGETVHVAADRVGPLVGVRVLDSRGAASVAYAAVVGAPGPTAAVDPEATTVTVRLGQSRTFRASLPGEAPTWYVDGQQATSGREFTFTPTLPQAGLHAVTVIGHAGTGQLARTWFVAVPAPDADGDGWWANIDCDDTRPNERLDDCSIRYTATTFARELGSVTGVAFDPQGRLTATNQGGDIYRIPASGGTGTETRIGSIAGGPLGAAYIGGRLFVTLPGSGKVVEVDPDTGALIRDVVEMPEPTGIAYDPTTGDLIVGSVAGNGIYRISGPLTAAPSVQRIAEGHGVDGVAVGPDGTVYAAKYQEGIWIVGGADAPDAGKTRQEIVAPAADGIAIETSGGRTVALWVNGTANNNGRIDRFDLTTTPPRQTKIYEAGGYGDFVAVGPDRCMYATNPWNQTITKVTNADGTCNLATPVGGLSLTPPAQTATVGQSVTLTVTRTPAAAGPVVVTVAGEHPMSRTVTTSAAGTATFTYTASTPGQDKITARVEGPGQPVAPEATVTWVAGPNRPPSLTAATAETRAGTPVTVRPEVADPDGDKVTLAILDGPTSGSASVDGTTVRYTPRSGFTGADSVAIVASDGRAESTPVRLAITVQPTDAPPEAGTVEVTTRAGRSVKITLVGTDAEGPVTFSIPTLETARYRPAHGRLGRVTGNTVRYTPKRGFRGTDGFVYQVTDSAGQQATGIVVVKVLKRHHHKHHHHHHQRCHRWHGGLRGPW